MARVIPTRMTAEIKGDFVVFLIGMRINKPWSMTGVSATLHRRTIASRYS